MREVGWKTTRNLQKLDQSSYFMEQSGPPIYNPEDYAIFLKKWTRRSDVSTSTSLVEGATSYQCQTTAEIGEMSLRQFSSVADLLGKLKNDLRLAYSSFVQEFVADPIDGVSLLLELLRSLQVNQVTRQHKVRPAVHRRSLLDEHSCLLCLRYCLRSQDAARRMVLSSTGLFTLAVCIMSSISKSRIIALELLTKICNCTGAKSQHHGAVSEAMSTMRLQFGEPFRFQFLVGMLSSAGPDLLLAGLRFINTFLETSPNEQMQLYIQTELQQAGFNITTIKKILPDKDQSNNHITEELNRWYKLYIDIEALKTNYDNKCKEMATLKEKLKNLEFQIKVLREENETLSIRSSSLKERQSELETQLTDLKIGSVKPVKENGNAIRKEFKQEEVENFTPAEDEGISSSDQNDCEELIDIHNQSTVFSSYSKYEISGRNTLSSIKLDDRIYDDIEQHVGGTLEKIDYLKSANCEITKNNDNKVKNCEEQLFIQRYQKLNALHSNHNLSPEAIISEECDIVPTCILPEPPRRSKSLFLINKNFETNPFYDDDDDDESFENSNSTYMSQDCSGVIQPNPYDILNFEHNSFENSATDKNHIISNNKKNGSHVNNIRRSQTFHHTQTDTNKFIPSPISKDIDKKKFDDNYFIDRNNNNNNNCRTNYAERNKNYRMNNSRSNKEKFIAQMKRGTTKESINDPYRRSSAESQKIFNLTDKNRTYGHEKSTTKLSRSLSTKLVAGDYNNSISYSGNKQTKSNENIFPYFPDTYQQLISNSSCQQFSLKCINNAGLYSGKNNISETSKSHLSKVTTITSRYPNRCLNGLKQINLNSAKSDKIMDLPSGLY